VVLDSGWVAGLQRAGVTPVSAIVSTPHRSAVAAAGLFLLAFGIAYGRVLVRLADDWANDPNYSHGFLVVPLVAYLVWERRALLAHAERRPTWLGLAVVAVGLIMLAGGTLGAELFTARVSLIVVLAGTVLFVLGPAHARILMFPLAFLILMIPLPAIVFNRIAFPLQIFASQFGEQVLQIVGVPVLREGNIITLSTTSLEVAEACSGIRSLATLITLGLVYGYFMEPRLWARVVIVATTIPIAIVTNGLRVAGTGVAAYHFGPEAAEGFFHTFSGWMVFVLAFGMVCIVSMMLQYVGRSPTGHEGGGGRAVPARATR
jgi:exosortase